MASLKTVFSAVGVGVTISLYVAALYHLIFGSPSLAIVFGGTGVLFASSMATVYYKVLGGDDG